jgi:(E)-4-hydroxy-3-methylbut-2-enyl-diphosphate synthase
MYISMIIYSHMYIFECMYLFNHILNITGNFMDGIKSFEDKVYNSRAEYDEDVIKIEELFTPLVLKCKENNRAMRIGN